jgi:hypothetical protein
VGGPYCSPYCNSQAQTAQHFWILKEMYSVVHVNSKGVDVMFHMESYSLKLKVNFHNAEILGTEFKENHEVLNVACIHNKNNAHFC